MTETSSFFVGAFFGVVVGIATALSATKYLASNGKATENVSVKTSTTADAKQKNESVSMVTKETDFPHDWFSSTDNFSLETRAIFSKVG